MLTLIIFIGLLIVLFALGIPVAFAIGLTSVVVLLVTGGFADFPFGLLALRMMHGVNSFSILAVPLFMLAANIMNASGVTDRIFRFANCLVGHLRGGLGHVNVLASMVFAGMSGTAVADAAGLGALEIKAMKEAGYDLGFSTGITGVSSVIGPIIPPSVGMIIYGWLSDVSIGGLFIGAIVPGILMGVALMIQIYFYALRSTGKIPPPAPRVTLQEFIQGSKDGVFALLTPIIIVGGIWGGAFTPTEAGAVASLYAVLLGMLIYKTLHLKQLLQVIRETTEFTGVILLIISFAMVYGWLLTRLQIPAKLAMLTISISSNPTLILFILLGFLTIVGCFMSVLSAITVFTPIMVPMIKQLGIDPLFFGIFMTITLSVGVVTPPFGNVIYVLVRISGLPFEKVVKSFLPFFVAIYLVIILLIFFPGLTTFLPALWLK
ncbi:TRAP-type transport system permease large protein [Candidatus Vecturithrix granuli]|uniref:TRAP-type transport system permease large protein n=1 Tax=Vecturithrix granuli TaxID=1499967 RepID=A0A081CA50_VECG1|nr:TRAP-type transport system permease large protein [Candidatus Vecturithrix granuli]